MQQDRKRDNARGKKYFFISKCFYICEVEPDKPTVFRIREFACLMSSRGVARLSVMPGQTNLSVVTRYNL